MPLGTKTRISVLAFATGFGFAPLFGQTSSSITAKNLVGHWQANTAEITDAHQDAYRFLADGKFIFEFSGYNETKRIHSLIGTYSLKGDLLSLVVTGRIELQGGRVVRDPQSRNGWTLVEAKSTTVQQLNSETDDLEIKICPVPGNKRFCISIGADKFFKISPTPK